MAEINDINIESADDIKIAIIVSLFSNTLQKMNEQDFTPPLGDWSLETKKLLANCGLIKLDETGKMKPFSPNGLDKDVKNRISGIVKILKFCTDNDIDIKKCDIAGLVKQMNAQKVKVATNKNVQIELITFLRANKELSIVSPETMKRYSDVIDMVSGKIDIEPGRKMSEFEAIALFDYATPIIRDRIILPINKNARENEKNRAEARRNGISEEMVRKMYPINSSFPELENVSGYYEFLGAVTMLITKATNERNAAKTELEKEKSSTNLKLLKEIKERFILEVGREISDTVKTFAMTRKNMSMETRRSKIEHDRLGVPDGLIPFLYEKHIPAENFDELLSTVSYLGAAKKYKNELNGIEELSENMRGRRPIYQETTRERRFNVYTELGRTFGLSDSNMISDFLLQGRNTFAFERFMAGRLEYEYEKINIRRQLKDMIKAYPQLKDEGVPVEVFRAGVLDENGSMSAKRREHPYSADKHVESGSKIKTSYISLTESPLIMGQFLYPFNSTNKRTVPTIIDIRAIYNHLLNRYQELENGNFNFAGQEKFVECLKQFAEERPEIKDEIMAKIQAFEAQKKDAILYERDMNHPEGFVSRESVARMPNTYSRTSAELLLKGTIPSESITQMDYLTSDILQRVCNTDAFDSVLNASRNRKHNIVENLKKFIGEESNLKDLGLEDYELDFIKQYYINGTSLEDIVSVPNAKGADNIELLAVGTTIRNNVTKKLLMNDKFLSNCLNVGSKEAEIIKKGMQDLYTAKMSKTSDKYTDKPIIAKDKKTDSGLYKPYDSDCSKKYIVADIRVVPKDRSREITIKRYSKVPFIKTVQHKVRNGITTVEEKDYEIVEDDEIYPFEVRYQAKNAAKKMQETSIIYHMGSKAQESDDREDNR